MRKERKKNGTVGFVKGMFPVSVLAALGSARGGGKRSEVIAEMEFAAALPAEASR